MEQAKTTSLRPNPWNSNSLTSDAERKLDESIRRNGLFKPIVVRSLADGSLEILGGQHRWESACRLGLEEVPVFNVGRIDDRKAKEISVIDNARYGVDNVVDLAGLLKEIGDTELLLEFMPIQAADLEAMRKAVDIDLDKIGAMGEEDDAPITKTSKPIKTHATMRFSVLVPNQPFIERLINEIIEREGFNDPDMQINAGDALMKLARFYDEAA